MGRKHLYGYFKRKTCEIVLVNTWVWLRKRNLKRKIESLLMAAHITDIKTNYIKVKLDATKYKE